MTCRLATGGAQIALMLAATITAAPLCADSGPAAQAVSDVQDANVSVITAGDIARERPASVLDLLRRRAGVDDTSGTLTLRGVPGVAVYLNGMPSSLVEITGLNSEEVERIEILRGAASARFGANAMGGAIVVSTRATLQHWALTLGTDSRASRTARFSGSFAAGPLGLQLHLNDDLTRDFRRVPDSPYPYQITVEDEQYGARGATVRATLQGEAYATQLEVKRADNHDSYGRPAWYADYRTDSTRLSGSRALTPQLALEFALGREKRDDKGLRDTGTGTDAAGLAPDRYLLSDSDKSDSELAAVWRRGTGAVKIGMHHQQLDESYAIRNYAGNEETFRLEASTVSDAAFLSVDGRVATMTLAGSGRCDDYAYPRIAIADVYGTPASPRTDVKLRSCNPKLDIRSPLGRTMSINASYGTGFVPPTPDQLYYFDLGTAAQMLANPDLKPEQSVTRDIGISVRAASGWDASAALFHSTWSDKIGIAIVDYGTPLKRQFRNIGETEATGTELQAKGPLWGAWSTTLGYTYKHARITRDEAHPEWVGNELPDMPRHRFNAALIHEQSALTARLNLRAVSAAYTDQANTVVDGRGYEWRKGGYTVLDTSMTFRRSGIELTVAVDNLFDQRYSTGFFRLGPERLVRTVLTLRF